MTTHENTADLLEISLIKILNRYVAPCFWTLLLVISTQVGGPNALVFAAAFGYTVLSRPPAFSFSPISMLYLYYGLWFVVAPLFAGRYSGALHLPEYGIAYTLAYIVLVTSVGGIRWGERASARSAYVLPRLEAAPVLRAIPLLIGLLFFTSTLFVGLIVANSGGISVWLSNPGDAFLNRGGTGGYVVLSHFSSITLAALVAYRASQTRSWWLLAAFGVWVVITSPVHGSKFQIALLLLIAAFPLIKDKRLVSYTTALLALGGIVVFLGGMFFRHQDILSSVGMVLSTLNYFTALENLAVSVRDFRPDFMTTFFMPFNKIWMAIGFLPPDSYFDMNHMLTARYYPEAWKIQATEQWPVETDLYLNFYFVFGLPLIWVFFAAHGALYGYARRTGYLGAWVASVLLIVGMLSHLRGSLYNHVDFYMYPFIALLLFALGALSLEQFNDRSVD